MGNVGPSCSCHMWYIAFYVKSLIDTVLLL